MNRKWPAIFHWYASAGLWFQLDLSLVMVNAMVNTFTPPHLYMHRGQSAALRDEGRRPRGLVGAGSELNINYKHGLQEKNTEEKAWRRKTEKRWYKVESSESLQTLTNIFISGPQQHISSTQRSSSNAKLNEVSEFGHLQLLWIAWHE